MDIPDTTLVTRALGGESAAFDELIRRHQPGLVRFILLMIGDDDEAESLSQEALTRAYAQLAQYRPEHAFPSWVRGIALNLSRNHLRARSRHARSVGPAQLREAASPEGRKQGVLSGIIRREIGDRTMQAVGQLPQPLREAFVLHYVEGLDYGDMSAITGVTAATLRVRAHRARTLLRNALGSVVDTWLRQARADEPEK